MESVEPSRLGNRLRSFLGLLILPNEELFYQVKNFTLQYKTEYLLLESSYLCMYPFKNTI